MSVIRHCRSAALDINLAGDWVSHEGAGFLGLVRVVRGHMVGAVDSGVDDGACAWVDDRYDLAALLKDVRVHSMGTGLVHVVMGVMVVAMVVRADNLGLTSGDVCDFDTSILLSVWADDFGLTGFVVGHLSALLNMSMRVMRMIIRAHKLLLTSSDVSDYSALVCRFYFFIASFWTLTCAILINRLLLRADEIREAVLVSNELAAI